MTLKSRLDDALSGATVRRDASGRWQKGTPSPNPAGRSTTRHDGWHNLLTGLGVVGKDKRQSTGFVADLVTAEEATDLWRGDDLAARAIETWPNEMLRQGFEFRVQSDAAEEAATDSDDARDLQEKVHALWEDLELDEVLWQALAWERAGGGSAILIGANDQQANLEEPLNIDRVASVDWLTAFESPELQPTFWYTDPRSKKYGKPEIYRFTPIAPGASKDGTALITTSTIHESRLIVFPGIQVTRRPVGTRAGWGDSILTRMRSVLRDFNVSWGSAAVLLADFAQAVYKMKGLSELVSQDQGGQFKIRLEAMELARSTIRATLIDAEEEFERKQTPITGLPELLDRLASRLAAAADMPLTLLMGTSPGGMNATGDSDIRFFYDRIQCAQKRKLKPRIEYLTKVLLSTLGGEPNSWSIAFNPLWQLSDQEQAAARKTQAESDAIYIANQVASPDDIARSRFGGDEYSYETMVDFEAREKMEIESKAAADEAEEIEAAARASALETEVSAENPTVEAPADEDAE